VSTYVPYRLAWTLAALLSIAAVYGFLHEHLFREFLWYPQGRAGLLLYASVFWPMAALIVWLAPRRLGLIAAATAIVYTAWWSGPAAPAAVLYLLGSCFLLGRFLLDRTTARATDGVTQTLVGAAVWMTVAWVALHFPVNNRWVYVAALALPYAGGFRSQARALSLSGAPGSRVEAAALALLLFIMGAHFLVALKPEISSDGLSMHLALPMAVFRDARWAFDVRHYAWSAMPIGGDTLYAVEYVLGGAQSGAESGAKSGEAAARLLNFAFLGMIVAMVARQVANQIRPNPQATPATAWLAAALFASTPLVQVVTGSLFIENVWAAFVLASALATIRYLDTGESQELAIAGFLLGAAAAVKLIAGAFLIPIAVLAVWGAAKRRQWKPLPVAAALAAIVAAPPYVYAYAKTGNPVFPFENQIFRSPQFDTSESFDDPRYHAPRSWKTPYEITFRSAQFIEGQGGAAGFQYFLLLAPALLLIRKRDQAALAIIAVGSALIILAVLPNLRYLYPVLPLFSILVAALAEKPPALASAAFTGLIALNFWFLPASGWYDNEFALFRHDAIRPYLEKMAPARLLIDRLNRTAPGEPAAFFSTDATADLNALAYTDTWHSELYWNRVRFATTPQQIVAVMNELGVRHVIAPASRQGASAPIHDFLARWLDPDGPPITSQGGALGLFRLRATPLAVPADTKPFGPGAYDDLIDGIEHSGGWIFDRQFSQAAHGTLTYSDTPGDFLRFQFSGTAVTYIYTQTFNRGIAQVSIDGVEHARVNLYAPRTLWQKSSEIRGLTPGVHTFELRVTGGKDPRSSGRFVDFDAFVVE
jgi:hypothetical protein